MPALPAFQPCRRGCLRFGERPALQPAVLMGIVALLAANCSESTGPKTDPTVADGGGLAPATLQPDGTCRVAQAALGAAHSCALMVSGELYCWGRNAQGQLGLSDPSQTPTAQFVSAAGRLNVHLTAEANRTCVKNARAEALCWGAGAPPSQESAQTAGSGAASTEGANSPQLAQLINAQKISEPRVNAITTGAHHSCFLSTDGSLFCWGGAGLVGDGTAEPRGMPTPVLGLSGGNAPVGGGEEMAAPENAEQPATAQILNLVAGPHATCVRDRRREVNCWGDVPAARPGDNPDTTQSPQPGLALTPLTVWPASVGVRFFDLGPSRLCALDGERQVLCTRGFELLAEPASEISDGGTSPDQADAAAADAGGQSPADAGPATGPGPEQPDGGQPDGAQPDGGAGQSETGRGTVRIGTFGSDNRRLAVGRDHVCVLSQSREIACIGDNTFGQAGPDPRLYIPPNDPVRLAALGTDNAEVLAGDDHSCALKRDGTLWCWGRGTEGQLGQGPSARGSAPAPVLFPAQGCGARLDSARVDAGGH